MVRISGALHQSKRFGSVACSTHTLQSVFESRRKAIEYNCCKESCFMEALLKLSWMILCLVHVSPALVIVKPGLLKTLYQIEPGGSFGLLMLHRGVLFLAIVAVTALAALDPNARRAAALVVGISMIGFLWLYAQAGFPSGALRKIAIADCIGLPFLIIVSLAAWRP
jgi:hypothetical protein